MSTCLFNDFFRKFSPLFHVCVVFWSVPGGIVFVCVSTVIRWCHEVLTVNFAYDTSLGFQTPGKSHQTIPYSSISDDHYYPNLLKYWYDNPWPTLTQYAPQTIQGQRARATSSTAATGHSVRFMVVERNACVTLIALHRTTPRQSVDPMVKHTVLNANSNSLLAVSRKISALPIMARAEVCYHSSKFTSVYIITWCRALLCSTGRRHIINIISKTSDRNY